MYLLVGNIGNPYTLEALKTTERSVTVGEISSFQLETVRTFRPRVSAVLNITPIISNRHHTMEAYAAAKEKIAENQTKDSICSLIMKTDYTKAFAGKILQKRCFFFQAKPEGRLFFCRGSDKIVKSTAEKFGILD